MSGAYSLDGRLNDLYDHPWFYVNILYCASRKIAKCELRNKASSLSFLETKVELVPYLPVASYATDIDEEHEYIRFRGTVILAEVVPS